jgi:hypothetical protein
MLKSDLKRGIFSLQFLFATLIIFVSLLIQWLTKTRELGGELPQVFSFSFSNIYVYAVPIAAILPFYGIYNDERKSGFIKFAVIRSSVKKYVFSKLFASAVSSFLAVFLGVLMFAVICGAFSLPFEPLEFFYDEGYIPPPPTLGERIINLGGFPLYAVVAGAVAGIFAAVWNFVGMAFSSFVNDKFLCFSITFTLYFMLNYVGFISWFSFGEDWEKATFINRFIPSYTSNPILYDLDVLKYKAIMLAVYSVIFIPIFYFFVKKRGVYDN